MRKSLLLAVLAVTALSCEAMRGPEPIPPQWQAATLYTCCNIHYERQDVNDANYYVGSMLPFGSPAQVQKVTRSAVTIGSGSTTLALVHAYGTAQETSQQYFDKILVPTDPHTTFDTYPKDVQSAIQNSRVEIGMTKPQVIMSLGYPPTHRTASTDLNTWTYWYNRWETYQIVFSDDGKVVNLVGKAPTSNQPIVAPTPTPQPAARPARRGKK